MTPSSGVIHYDNHRVSIWFLVVLISFPRMHYRETSFVNIVSMWDESSHWIHSSGAYRNMSGVTRIKGALVGDCTHYKKMHGENNIKLVFYQVSSITLNKWCQFAWNTVENFHSKTEFKCPLSVSILLLSLHDFLYWPKMREFYIIYVLA
jgi:hypothetical protein